MAVAESAQDLATNWQLWCRLCAKDDIQGNINVFLKNEADTTDAGGDLTMAIGKYFWVNITRGEELPEMICTECLGLVTSLVNFSERITRVQKMYCILQSRSKQKALDMRELRTRFGLLDEEREAVVLPQQALTEVHYVVDEKPKINEQGLLEEALELENPLTPCRRTEGGENKDEEINAAEEDESLADSAEDLASEPGSASSCSSKSSRPVREIIRRRGRKKGKEKTSDGKIYECSECYKVYTHTWTLQRHMRHHTKEEEEAVSDQTSPGEQLPCAECDKKFRTRYQLQRHMQQHVPITKRKIYPCNSCGKKFTSNYSAQLHAQYMHQDERPRPFICEQCGVAVHSNAALKEHMLRHTDYAPFECDICKKCFKSANRLKHHKETHDPHKYICPECGMQLNSRPTLNRHRLVHTDQMQHKCDYCGREFKRAKALKNHLILHTGLKPYSCDFCDRTFANGSNCRTHKKKSHPVELAEQEAAGGAKTYNRNIPKLEALKAFTKNKDNLSPVATKQSGCFAFGKKPKPPSTVPEAAAPPAAIPTIDNIYNHIMKQSPTVPKEELSPSTVAAPFAPEQLLLTTTDNGVDLLQATQVLPTSPSSNHIEEPSDASSQVFSY
ncbi:zinc finger protein weckle [Scaptodrosophila lebanonensis]|uniref:Zinc finger protein weckle n=1 Tax=Drosophila lebanonensis TaxID=7225 RepID=A0A6J2TK04_DROLE|nr:zinc finger protein weckle [Scaptodrosophila lebanonensis]